MIGSDTGDPRTLEALVGRRTTAQRIWVVSRWCALACRRPLAWVVVGLLLSLAIPVSAASVATAASLVPNGDFEQPVISPPHQEFSAGQTFGPWTVEDGWLLIATSSQYASASGNQHVMFNLDAMAGQRPATLYQDLLTTAGARYHLRFAYAGDANVAGHPGCFADQRVKKLGVVFGNSSMITYSFDTTGHSEPDAGWVYADRLVTADSATTRLRFRSLHDGNCGPMLDDVSLTDPAPSQTATSLSASSESSVVGEAVTFTATVIGATAGITPAGSVQFEVDGVATSAPVSLDAQGRAAHVTTALGVGSHTITALFVPSGQGTDPSEAQLSHQVAKASTTTSLVVEPDPTVAGQDATFTATVAVKPPGAGVPSGSVQFSEDDGRPIGPPQALDSGGHATVVSFAGAGSYRVHADYLGDARFSPSAAFVPQQVNKADTVTTITSAPNPVAPGAEVEFTVEVAVVEPGDVPPYGALRFTVNGAPLGAPIPLMGYSGVVVTATAPTVPQTVTVGVAYSGDQNTNPSSASLTQVVGATTSPAPRPALTAPPPPSGATPTAARLNMMVSGLARILRRRGLAGLSGAHQTFDAAEAGVVDQKIYAPSRPVAAARAQRGRVLIASGRRVFPTAGTGTMRVRLTAAGRRRVRRAHKLKLTILTRFTPTAGAPIVTTRRLSVQRKRGVGATTAAARWDPGARWRRVAVAFPPDTAACAPGPRAGTCHGLAIGTAYGAPQR